MQPGRNRAGWPTGLQPGRLANRAATGPVANRAGNRPGWSTGPQPGRLANRAATGPVGQSGRLRAGSTGPIQPRLAIGPVAARLACSPGPVAARLRFTFLKQNHRRARDCAHEFPSAGRSLDSQIQCKGSFGTLLRGRARVFEFKSCF